MEIAVGIILEKRTQHGLKVAVVHRGDPGPGWSLPRGSTEPSAAGDKAALRLVGLETGCTGADAAYAGVTDEVVEGNPHPVLYWRVSLDREDSGDGRDRQQSLSWIFPEEAWELLTVKGDRTVLARVYNLELSPGSKTWSRWKCFKAALRHSLRWRRLASAIHSYRQEIPGLESLTSCGHEGFERVRSLLDEAQHQLENGDIHAGWKLFHAAQRAALLCLNKEHQRKAHARQMLKEADKIKGWRKDAIKDLVGDEHTVPSMEDLHQAALVRDEYFANNAYKAMMLKNQAVVLAVILVSVLAICQWRFNVQEEGLPMAITVGLFGILGGTVSAITSVPRSLESTRIPEMSMSFQVTLLRLFMGGASAFVLFILLTSDLADQVLSGIFAQGLAEAIKSADSSTLYFIAFCAGFSERLVKRAVEVVAGR